ncbi:VOC family protein [Roseomonas elaeocarpi]|uniref:VOC family protein n=1 Tax=Roseomonas elaeocarpi TaxID=907779 RepID=A0ABV6JNB5_9PROT
MFVPNVEKNPPFNITRASHVRYRVKDLDRSLVFYTEVLGFVLSDREGGVAYLRGIEEACHHSVVLIQSDEGGRVAECIGMRVASEDDLHRAREHITATGGSAEFIERPHQGPTLLTTMAPGTPPIELCSSMPVLPRLLNNFPAQKGGRVLRLDHYQCVVPDLPTAVNRFLGLGFRPSKYTTDVDSGQVLSIFLTRKNNPHDIVLAQAAGPRLHHVAFVVSDLQAIIRAADIAANLGWGRDVEHGPGRHGPPNGIFIYFRDPDGNRIEFILPPMQFMDPEDMPNTWNSTDSVSLVPWGSGPPQRWREEMTHFAGIEPGGGPLARWTSLTNKTG